MEEEVKERTLEDIEEVLNRAKLDRADLSNTSQAIYFTKENLHDNNFKLLQLDPLLMSEITSGNKLYVKGDTHEDLVICTENRTFHVTAAETSNSLLLVNNLKFHGKTEDVEEVNINVVEVLGICQEYMEATVGKPHMNKLKLLLEESIYKGPEHEHEYTQNIMYSFDQLCDIVQASNKELRTALNSMNIIEIDGKIRLLDFEYHFRALSYMLKLIDENSWQIYEIDYEMTVESLTDIVPREVVTSLFEKYTEESEIVDGTQLYRYKETEVCTFFAEVLLHESGKFNLHEFLQAWQESVPDGMITDEEMLYGIAVIDRTSNPNVIWAFDESKLPENINERLKVLFETKEKWSVTEITPFIKRLATEKMDVNALLAKHARASKIDGIKYYSAKHGK